MSRRRRAVRKPVSGDPRYNNVLIEQLTNRVMRCGKKALARRIVYGAIDQVCKKLNKEDPAEIFSTALDNIRPKLEVKSRRVGGANYQMPVEIPYARQVGLAFRWIILAANKRAGRMIDGLADELVDAYNNVGEVVKKRDEMHRIAQSNRAFAFFK